MGGGVSDAAFVEQRLREMKYQGTWHQNKADQYGSQAARERIYLFAHRGHRADIPLQAALAAGSIKIDRLPWTSFWPEEWWNVFAAHWNAEDHDPGKCNRADPSFRDEHLAAF